MNVLLLLALATGALCVAFALCYLLARRIDNYGIVDIAWSYAFGVVGLFYALAAAGATPRRILLGTMVGAWSARLGTHLYRRVMSHHPTEDTRYRQLREDWAADFPRKMFGFFQVQALSVVFLAIPFLVSLRNPAPGLHPLEYTGAALWLLGLGGEALADAQLAAFKRDPANKGRVCDRGLWSYSRHPNYFFEWLTWVAYWLFACASPWGWATVTSPALMLYFLVRVTGIPATEQQSLRNKGEAYRAYQRTTSAFVPWFKKR
ncbi:MAG: DUF1295 domain-containing protein [Verrucomicrobiota bacterium]